MSIKTRYRLAYALQRLHVRLGQTILTWFLVRWSWKIAARPPITDLYAAEEIEFNLMALHDNEF